MDVSIKRHHGFKTTQLKYPLNILLLQLLPESGKVRFRGALRWRNTVWVTETAHHLASDHGPTRISQHDVFSFSLHLRPCLPPCARRTSFLPPPSSERNLLRLHTSVPILLPPASRSRHAVLSLRAQASGERGGVLDARGALREAWLGVLLRLSNVREMDEARRGGEDECSAAHSLHGVECGRGGGGRRESGAGRAMSKYAAAREARRRAGRVGSSARAGRRRLPVLAGMQRGMSWVRTSSAAPALRRACARAGRRAASAARDGRSQRGRVAQHRLGLLALARWMTRDVRGCKCEEEHDVGVAACARGEIPNPRTRRARDEGTGVVRARGALLLMRGVQDAASPAASSPARGNRARYQIVHPVTMSGYHTHPFIPPVVRRARATAAQARGARVRKPPVRVLNEARVCAWE
ncbi:hypothetical protein DFH09DRAFT_1085190 [Mycena vulgaris]|nr:hypothetical protein DFH09DRAFT_1085190 [Mycena vulgaris]